MLHLSSIKYRIAPWIGYHAINTLASTLSIKTFDLSNLDWQSIDPCLLVCWHRDLLLIPIGFQMLNDNLQTHPISAIASQHGDGRIAANILKKFGIKSIDGSSSSHALHALLKVRKLLKSGYHVALTPDGPKGPPCIPKRGAITMALKLNVPIVPFSVVANSAWTLNSWDHMFIPKPFSKVVTIIGEPITGSDKPNKKELLEQNNLLKERLDSLKNFGQTLLKKIPNENNAI
jgi:lysophospholipid acyltransferase (LPLAT)-like uncharacterized protein